MSFKVSVISCLRLGQQICAKEYLPSFEVPFVLPIVTAELQINSREKLLDIFLKEATRGQDVGFILCLLISARHLPCSYCCRSVHAAPASEQTMRLVC